MTQTRYAPKYFEQQRHKHQGAKTKAKQLGEKYYALARTYFARSDYPSAGRLCAIGMKLSAGPFILAVRDQMEDLWATCERLIAPKMDLNHRESCAITVQYVGTVTPKTYLAFLDIDGVAELEYRLLRFKETGVIDSYELFPPAGAALQGVLLRDTELAP
jgi:hypothetical protein